MGNSLSTDENERKFLVTGDGWRSHVTDDTHIIQGYIPPSQTDVRLIQKDGKCELLLEQESSWIKGEEKKPKAIRIPVANETAEALLRVFRGVKDKECSNLRLQSKDRVNLLLSEDDTLRIRLDKYGAKLAIKSPRTYQNKTIVRKEIECPIDDPEIAEYLLNFYSDRVLEKHRFYVPYGDEKHRWEIDVFTDDPIKGLVTAEIELDDPKTQIEIPSWIGKDVTKKSQYSSRALASKYDARKVVVTDGEWQRKILSDIAKQHEKSAPHHRDLVSR
jgi:CYTH domain-containing protein